jgi:cytochrome c
VKHLPGAGAAILLTGAACAAPSPTQLAQGEQVYRRCVACHALEPGRNTPAGPTLHGIVGRPIAAERGFDYSPALRRFAVSEGNWTPALLDRFLADPETVVPGTEMGLIGVAEAGEREALIAWLRTTRRSGR